MPIPPSAPTLTRSLAREDVYRIIKQWIVELQLAPDEVIRDHELAERLGVSRTPVREALRRLEDEGLVVTSFHKWTKVAPCDYSQMEHLYPVLAALEGMAVELALVHITPADLDQLRTLNRALAHAIEQGDVEQAAELDTQFHGLIVRKSGNSEVEKLLGSLLPRVKRLELVHFGDQRIASQSVAEHEAIITALQQGDASAAADAMRQNWLLAPVPLHAPSASAVARSHSSDSHTP